VFAGKNSEDIAGNMQVSPHTVDEWVRRALKILGVSNRIEATHRLASYGIFRQVTPYQSLTYQPDKLSFMSKTTESGFGTKEDMGREDDFGPQRIFRPAADLAGRWMKRISWLVLVAATSFLAFTLIHFCSSAWAVA
jgi:hypothetical protein